MTPWTLRLFKWIFNALLWGGALGLGVYYMSSSINGTSIGYTSLTGFLKATGACVGDSCDLAATQGCILCPYVGKLFYTIGLAAQRFWGAIIDNIWILLALGFVVFLFIHTLKFIQEAAAKTAELSTEEQKFDFKEWFDPVWKQLVRVLVVGAFIGGIGLAGTGAVKTVARISIAPVMYVGGQLSMAATGIASAAKCPQIMAPAEEDVAKDIIGPAMGPFMCVIGNLNTVILAGASGGFALMNMSYMDLGGGVLTWLAGLAIVILFVFIGFNIFWKILNVVFMLVFLIIFLPLLVASYAYENQWKMLSNWLSNSIGLLAKSAIRIILITLETLIIYAVVLFAADEYFPGPRDNYSAIMPPGIALNMSSEQMQELDPESKTGSIAYVFDKCEKEATIAGQEELDKDKFKDCFLAEKERVEQDHPGAFDFLEDGWSFLLMIIGIFLVYYYVVEKKVKKLLGGDSKDPFEYGSYVRDFGKMFWDAPGKLFKAASGKVGKT
jgi:hypothetical protein